MQLGVLGLERISANIVRRLLRNNHECVVELGWNIVSLILDAWAATPPQGFPNYAAGSWGPKDADELLQRDGRQCRE